MLLFFVGFSAFSVADPPPRLSSMASVSVEPAEVTGLPFSFMNHPILSYPRLPGTPVSNLPFSPCVVVGDLIFVSGQASVDLEGKIIADTFEGEFRRSVENVQRVLEAAGSDLAHVVQTRNFVRDVEDLPLYNQLYREFFPEPRPARTTITNCLPPTLRYEIEVIAVRRVS